MRFSSLVYEHLCHSTIIVRRSADRNVLQNEMLSVISDSRHTVSTARVVWTHGDQQLAVIMPQVTLAAFL